MCIRDSLGIVVKKDDGTLDTIYADYTVLASGGIGGIYRYSTNYRHLTGDAVACLLYTSRCV